MSDRTSDPLTNSQRANLIARGIFAAGDEPDDKVQRIEFKGGKWPDTETSLGGLSLGPLAGVILRILEQMP